MDIKDLRYLCASADLGNFARAAKSLGLNTSTVSRRVGRVEDKLGVTLFERSHAGVRLTPGGRAVLLHVRRALAELDAITCAGTRNGSGVVGEVRLGIRMPPIGEPIRGLLMRWHAKYPDVTLTIAELNHREIAAALEERRLDAALIPGFTLWPHAAALPVYRERLIAALPTEHPLADHETLNWTLLAAETILVQGWDESQAQRELFASLLGSGTRFQVHAASKQSVFALVGAGFGITLAVQSQGEATFPGVIFRPIDEPNASLTIKLAWMPESEEPAVGRFIAFMRDEAELRCLV